MGSYTDWVCECLESTSPGDWWRSIRQLPAKFDFAPLTELAYVPFSKSGFSGFESLVGHQMFDVVKGDTMLKQLLAGAVIAAALSGCVAYPVETETVAVAPTIAVGFYDPAFGFWTGYGWDRYYYTYGHPGYGRPFYHGPRYIGGHGAWRPVTRHH